MTTIVATPHVLRDPWLNEDPAARQSLVSQLNERLGGSPLVVPGCEYLLGVDVLGLVEAGEAGPLTRLNHSRYLLVEVSPGFVPRDLPETVHECVLLGVVPVLAHPERIAAFVRDPRLVEAAVARGAVVQITAGSLLGHFGRQVKAAADELLGRGAVHLVASDAHSVAQRPPCLSAAREQIRRDWGADVERGLFVDNPEAVLRSEPIPFAWHSA